MFEHHVMTSSPNMYYAKQVHRTGLEDSYKLPLQSTPRYLERFIGFTTRLVPVAGRPFDLRLSSDFSHSSMAQPRRLATLEGNAVLLPVVYGTSVSSKDGTSSSATTRRSGQSGDVDFSVSVGGATSKSCDRSLWIRRCSIAAAIRQTSVLDGDASGTSRMRSESVGRKIDSKSRVWIETLAGGGVESSEIRQLERCCDVRYETGCDASVRCHWRREEGGFGVGRQTVGVSVQRQQQQQHQQQDSTWSVFAARRMNGDDGGITTITPSEALRQASAYGLVHRVRQLLAEQTVSGRDQDGFTALHLAVINNHPEIVSLLVNDHFGLLEIRDKSGQTALHHATILGNVEIVCILLEAGSQVDRRCGDELGNCSIHLAANRGFSETLQQLVIHQADVQICNQSKSTALHLAAQSGHNQSARILLFAGCNPNAKNSFGDTPLHTASRYGHAGVASILINARCKVNIQNTNGDTALHIAAALKRKKITTILIEAGIDCNVRNKQSERAVEVAMRKEHTEIISLLTQKVSKSKRKVDAIGNIHSSAELITVSTSGDKKKNQFLSFFSRRKKPKKVDANTGSEMASPDELVKVNGSPSEFDVVVAAEREREFARTQSWRDRLTKGADRQIVDPTNESRLSPCNENRAPVEPPRSNMAADPTTRRARSTVPVDFRCNQHEPLSVRHHYNDVTEYQRHQPTQQRQQRHQVSAVVHWRHQAADPHRAALPHRCAADGEDWHLSRSRSDDTLSTASGAVRYHDDHQLASTGTTMLERLEPRQFRVQQAASKVLEERITWTDSTMKRLATIGAMADHQSVATEREPIQLLSN